METDKLSLGRCHKEFKIFVNGAIPSKLRDSFYKIFYSQDIDGLKDLLSKGMDINYKTKNGFTLLHYTVIEKKFYLLSFILSYPNIKMDEKYCGKTPLICSLMMDDNFESVTMKLIEAGCNVNITNKCLETPLHKAVTATDISLDICEALIEKGADINARNICGVTALHLATDHVKLVDLLLYSGADPTIKCNDGTTPFIRSLDCDESASTLIKYVVDINSTFYYNNKESNALLLSLRYKSPIAYEIIEIGGDVNYICCLGYYALLLSGEYDKRLFDIIWSKMDKKIILKSSLCLFNYMINNFDENLIECIYQVFDCDIISDIVDQYVHSSTFFILIRELHESGCEKEDRLKMIYLLLSYSVSIEISDLYYIYEYFGYNEEMEALLITSRIEESFSDEQDYMPYFCLIPTFLINYKMDVNDLILKFIQNCNLVSEINKFFNELINIFKYCTPTKEIRDAFHKKCDNNSELDLHRRSKSGWNNEESKDLHKSVVQLFVNRPLPSLLELARNSTRKRIIDKYKVTNSYDYVKAVEALTLPTKIKETLLFKLPLYEY